MSEQRATRSRAMRAFDATCLAVAIAFILACAAGSSDFGGDDGGYSRAEEEDRDDVTHPGDDDDDAADDDDTTDLSEDEEEEPEDVVEDPCEGAKPHPVTWAMSADDSNSQADPARVRHHLVEGAQIVGSPKPHEFLNYYDFGFELGDDLQLVAQMRRSPLLRHHYSVLVGIVGPAVAPRDRRPMNLTFSVDSSGSMDGQGLDMARASLLATAASLQEGDRISLVSWDTSKDWLLDGHEVSGPDDPVVLDAIIRLEAGGSTDLANGLAKAYKSAAENYSPDRLNRVVLMSDGLANTGVTDEQLIASWADDAEDEGIYLVGVGVGDPLVYNEQLMNTVTDLGRGAYIYIDSVAEAQVQFSGDRLLSNLEVAARAVQLQVTLPPGFTIRSFHGEGMSKTPEELDPQHLAPNDAMLFHFVVKDCDPTLAGDEFFGFEVDWETPEDREPRQLFVEKELTGLLAGSTRQLEKADAVVAWAKAIGEVQAMPWTEIEPHLDEVAEQVNDTMLAWPDDADLQEVAWLLELYADRF